MGCCQEKARPITKVINYANLAPPDKFVFIKLTTYNINLYNSLSIRDKIYNILKYLFEPINGKRNDIICIQGFKDRYSQEQFIRNVLIYAKKSNIKLFISPTFDNINTNISQLVSESFNIVWNSSHNKSESMKDDVSNVIISTYEILGYKKVNNVLISNILIKNTVVSIYNVLLVGDLTNVNISFAKNRRNSIDEIEKLLHENIVELKKYAKNKLSNIHLIVGTMNVNEVENNKISDEYLYMLSKFKYDIHRCLNAMDVSYTSRNHKRSDYILMYICPDIYKNQKITSNKDLMNLVFNKYNIHFIESNIKSDIETIHYPVETVMMLKT